MIHDIAKPEFVQFGKHLVNLVGVASAHWEGETLYVHMIGGRFLSLRGTDAEALWQAVQAHSTDLRTGEVRE